MKYYTKDHEWVEADGDEAFVGISSYAANELGDITYVELPNVGADMIVGDVIGVVESVKAASDIYSPVSGTVIDVNSTLEDDPGLVNSSAEKDAWIFKLENIDSNELEELMTAEDYQKYVDSL